MKMVSVPRSRRICELERSLLRTLCQPCFPDTLRESLGQQLSAYQWQTEDHRIIFNVFRGIPNTKASSLREQLPARVARMGFPDVDWAFLFEPAEPIEAIADLIAELKAAERIC
jgi:hypothetical protein